MTFKDKIKACYKILFKNKPFATITYGVRVVKCDECEYNLKCEECKFKSLHSVKESEVKAKVCKELAEKLKERKKKYEGTLAGCTFMLTELEDVINEMVGDSNA